MVDSKTVGSQVQELQIILHDMIAEDMVVNEAFQVAAMIEKLLPSWNDFKNYLKHKFAGTSPGNSTENYSAVATNGYNDEPSRVKRTVVCTITLGTYFCHF